MSQSFTINASVLQAITIKLYVAAINLGLNRQHLALTRTRRPGFIFHEIRGLEAAHSISLICVVACCIFCRQPLRASAYVKAVVPQFRDKAYSHCIA